MVRNVVISEARYELKGGWGSCSQQPDRENWILLCLRIDVRILGSQRQLIVKKYNLIMHNNVFCTHRNSQLSRNGHYCNSSVSQKKNINWIHHFWWACHCGLFSSYPVCKHVYIAHSSANFPWFVFSQAVLIQIIPFSISTGFVWTQLNVKTVLY